MIKYQTTENKYYYDMSLLQNILDIIDRENYYSLNNCTQEKIGLLIDAVNSFLKSINPVESVITKERHETEEEAREYFGEDFINQFNDLLTRLDNEQTIVAIHGTNPSICPRICEEGLRYKSASITATAVQQRMNYGREDMNYTDFESLLNWGHKDYKGLVLIAVPYECYYKEGLWNHFQSSDYSFYDVQDYRINPDFIVGYIDVLSKKLVLNPKYSREHNYEGYERDNDVFREQKDMDNDTFKNVLIESEELMNESLNYEFSYDNYETEIDPNQIVYMTEPLIGVFNSIKKGFPKYMTEERYKMFLEQLANDFKPIQVVLPKLKTQAEVLKEQEENDKIFANSESFSESDFDFDDVWEDEDFDNEGPKFI